MKKLFLMLVCVFSVLTMTAQTKVTWNMELGLGMSGWMGKHADGSKGLFSQKVGVGLDIPLTGLVSFQSGLMWVSKGASYDMEGTTELLSKNKVHVNQNYFQMPLLAAFHIGTAANFDMVFTAGPYLAYGVCGKSEFDIDDLTVGWDTFENSNVDDETILGLNRFDAGLQLGIGLDFGKWTAGLDGEFGFCKIASGQAPHNLAFFLKAGYKF